MSAIALPSVGSFQDVRFAPSRVRKKSLGPPLDEVPCDISAAFRARSLTLDNAPCPVTGLLAVHRLTTKRGKMGRPRLFESCTFEGCERPHRSRGLCRAHYSQRARGVPLTPIGSRPEVPEKCTYEGCDRPYVGKGYCMTHYQQQRRGRALKPIAAYTRSS